MKKSLADRVETERFLHLFGNSNSGKIRTKNGVGKLLRLDNVMVGEIHIIGRKGFSSVKGHPGLITKVVEHLIFAHGNFRKIINHSTDDYHIASVQKNELCDIPINLVEVGVERIEDKNLPNSTLSIGIIGRRTSAKYLRKTPEKMTIRRREATASKRVYERRVRKNPLTRMRR